MTKFFIVFCFIYVIVGICIGFKGVYEQYRIERLDESFFYAFSVNLAFAVVIIPIYAVGWIGLVQDENLHKHIFG